MKSYTEPIGIKKDCVNYKNGCIARMIHGAQKRTVSFTRIRQCLTIKLQELERESKTMEWISGTDCICNERSQKVRITADTL